MKSLRYSSLALLIAGTLLTTSCKKDKATPAKTQSDYLQSGSWKEINTRESITIGSGAAMITTILPLDCEKDNLLTFKPANVAVFDNGTIKCDSSEVRTANAIWNLSADNKSLNVTLYGFPQTLSIDKLDASTLVLSYKDILGDTSTISTTTFSH